MRSFNKIFCLGLTRTGTTSMSEALQLLGLRAWHHPQIESHLQNAQYRIPEFEDFDAFLDISVVRVYKQFDRAYPGSLFILTERDIDSWLESCRVFFEHRDHTAAGTHIEKRMRFYRLLTYGCEEFCAERMRQAYEDHVADVIHHFSKRPQDLLRFNAPAGDGWKKLCDFLEAPVPSVPYPRSNTLAEAMERRSPRYGLITITDPDYLPITETMMSSFRRCNPWFHGTYLLIVEDAQHSAFRAVGARDDVELVEVRQGLKRRIATLCKSYPELESVYPLFHSLEAFRLKGFSRLVYVDSDVLFRGDVRHLFEHETGIFAAPDRPAILGEVRCAETYRHGSPGEFTGGTIDDSFNAGLMVLCRDVRGREIYRQLLDRLAPAQWEPVRRRKIGDQLVLNRQFTGRVNALDIRDNFLVRDEEDIRMRSGELGHYARVWHYIGPQKPWLRLDVDVASSQWKYIEAWRREFRAVIEEADGSPLERWPGIAAGRVFRDGFEVALDTTELLRLMRSGEQSPDTVTGDELREVRNARRVSPERLAHSLGSQLIATIEKTTVPLPESIVFAYEKALARIAAGKPRAKNEQASKPRWLRLFRRAPRRVLRSLRSLIGGAQNAKPN